MNYREAIEYLCVQAPMFQQIGSGAYKEGLGTTLLLDEHAGHPHRQFRSVHIAGTNGKGSTAHTLAAIFQAAGYRTGLYTSPHLTDFSERIRVNGQPINQQYVIDFLESNKEFHEPLHPSFFELTTCMAFSYFAHCHVDIAIIETGLGGRLDCTNIITPDLSVITNIGFDHMQFLGGTLAEIAGEKAGIIKSGVTAVIGEDNPETRPVFQAKAGETHSRIVFAQDNCKVNSISDSSCGKVYYDTAPYPQLETELKGYCQSNNANTILHAVEELRHKGWILPECAVRQGFAQVCGMTGLRGRWQKLSASPDIICDTGHNSHGLKYIARHLTDIAVHPSSGKLRIVFGMVNDKDIDVVLNLMPKNAVWYYTQASVRRALPADRLREMAVAAGHDGSGRTYPTVSEAVNAARNDASVNDTIFVGGSSFVVADLLSMPEFAD